MPQPQTRYAVSALALCSALLGVTSRTLATEMDDIRVSEVIANTGSKQISLPMLKSDYDVTIDGTVANVTVKQMFFNPGPEALNATYLFPLNQKAAVYSMTMEVGDEIIKAVIQRKEEAQETFETARAEGKTAALLDQHRPNMFTQNIANLMPETPVTITLKYAQKVPRIDDAYELVVPMIVGPRYEGALPARIAEDLGLDFPETVLAHHDADELEADSQPVQTETVSGWTIERLPSYPSVIGHDAPADIDPERVSFKLALVSGAPIQDIVSSTHPLVIDAYEHEASARLADGHTVDNKDLVLRYELGEDDSVAIGALSHMDERGGFVALQIEPPEFPEQDSVMPRELIFVLDTSGSMNGAPMRASKQFMRAALNSLQPMDHFRILRFSSNTSQFAKESVPATASNVKKGIRFVNGLSAGGGTEMNYAINNAFDQPPIDNTLRLVVFLTDGYIGADRQVIETIGKRIGNARIYAFGVGNSVNRYLLDGMAKEGRGRARYIETGENSSEVAAALAADLSTPLLTDISIDWNGLDVDGQAPDRIPDLFAGHALNMFARYEKGGQHTITINGRVNGRKASLPVTLDLADSPTGQDSALPVIWAREQVFDLERDYTLSGGVDSKAKEGITQIGLGYSLQTAFTSFVAVSEKVYNEDPEQAHSAAVPLPQASGVPTSAYPTLNMGGSSTPEPEALFGFLGALMLVLARYAKAIRRSFKNLVSKAVRKEPSIRHLPKRLTNDGWWLEPGRR